MLGERKGLLKCINQFCCQFLSKAVTHEFFLQRTWHKRLVLLVYLGFGVVRGVFFSLVLRSNLNMYWTSAHPVSYDTKP